MENAKLLYIKQIYHVLIVHRLATYWEVLKETCTRPYVKYIIHLCLMTVHDDRFKKIIVRAETEFPNSC